MADEIVALFDQAGAVVGQAPRSQVRADNLTHGATSVLVRNSQGQIYVHRRTDTKDVYPGRYDFAAGGVLLAGEDPDQAALREAEEELGVTGVELRPLGRGFFGDDQTRYVAYLYEATFDGPIRHQAEEVAWGDWVTRDDLLAWLNSQPSAFMPDSVALLHSWL